jgi:hypothetical protein
MVDEALKTMSSRFDGIYPEDGRKSIPPEQVLLLDQATGKQIDAAGYLNAKKAAALQGQVYNPNMGFATLNNAPLKPQYPYDPFYGRLSPRVAAAWNPSYSDGLMGKIFGSSRTVIRGGYSRVFGRINGVARVLRSLFRASARARPDSV